jgi:hypothetical protein
MMDALLSPRRLLSAFSFGVGHWPNCYDSRSSSPRLRYYREGLGILLPTAPVLPEVGLPLAGRSTRRLFGNHQQRLVPERGTRAHPQDRPQPPSSPVVLSRYAVKACTKSQQPGPSEANSLLVPIGREHRIHSRFSAGRLLLFRIVRAVIPLVQRRQLGCPIHLPTQPADQARSQPG